MLKSVVSLGTDDGCESHPFLILTSMFEMAVGINLAIRQRSVFVEHEVGGKSMAGNPLHAGIEDWHYYMPIWIASFLWRRWRNKSLCPIVQIKEAVAEASRQRVKQEKAPLDADMNRPKRIHQSRNTS